MDFNLVNNIESCYIEVPRLLYYSHIPAAIVSLLVGFFVFLKNKNVVSKTLLALSMTFTVWLFFDLITWIGVDSRVIMFVWSFFGILTALVFALSFYFIYTFVKNKDLDFKKKVIIGSFFLPILFLAPFYLRTFDVQKMSI